MKKKLHEYIWLEQKQLIEMLPRGIFSLFDDTFCSSMSSVVLEVAVWFGSDSG